MRNKNRSETKNSKIMIMKKQYVSPVCGILNLPVPTLMTGSLDPEKSVPQNVTPDPDEPSPDKFTTRRQSAWGDEEEE